MRFGLLNFGSSGGGAVAAGGGGDSTAPVLVSAVVNAAGTQLALTYGEALDAASVPATGAYGLTGALLASITAVSILGAVVTLTLTPLVATLPGAVLQQDTAVKVSYTPGASPIRDAAGNNAAALVARAVTNNSTADLTPAELVEAVGAVATAESVTIRGFWVADLGRSHATDGTHVSAWAPQLGTMPSYLTSSSGVEPIYTASDSNYGGRASISSDGTRWMSNAFNPPLPSTTAEHRLAAQRMASWVSARTFNCAATGRFGARNNTRTSTAALAGNLAIGPEVDNFERRAQIYEVLCAGGTASKLRIGPAQNVATGVAIESQDPASTGLFSTNAGASIWAGSVSCWLVASGTMSVNAVALFEKLFVSYTGGADAVISAYNPRAHKIARIHPSGASIMRNEGATNYDGYRKYVNDQALAAGYTIDCFGIQADGTQADNGHSGISGNGIAQCTTAWDASFGATKQFNLWPQVVWLSIGAADILLGTSGATAAAAYKVLVQHMIDTEPQLKTFIVMTEPPINGSGAQNTEMAAFNAALSGVGGVWDQLAAANPTVDFSCRADLYGAMGGVYNPSWFVVGQNHPNDAGYAVLSPVIWAAVQARLEAVTHW